MFYHLFFLLLLVSSCVSGPSTKELVNIVDDLKCAGKSETMSERKVCLNNLEQHKADFDQMIKQKISAGATQELIDIKKDIENNICDLNLPSNDHIVKKLQKAYIDTICTIDRGKLKDYLMKQ